MIVDVEVEEGLRGRTDLRELVDAAAEFLASRDRDADGDARAAWHVWRGPQDRPLVTLALRDGGYSATHTFAPAQLTPPDVRELRLLAIWDRVLKHRLDAQMRRTNEVIAQLED